MKTKNLVGATLGSLSLFLVMFVTVERAAADESGGASGTATVSDSDRAATIQVLQQSLEQQRQLLTSQAEQLERQQQHIREQQEQLQEMEMRLLQLAAADEAVEESDPDRSGQVVTIEPADDQPQPPASTQSGEAASPERVAERRLTEPEDPSDTVPESRAGYLYIPGTDASMKLGGYVKMSIVQSFDPIGSADRFVTASIPVTGDEDANDNQASLTTRQSRLNLDVRRSHDMGDLRAFLEGDFAGAGDTFRLRHAFGQFRQVLAGKTWSTFVDSQAVPEDIDFEGLNGRVNVRQPQLRFFPSIGENLHLAVAIEDPGPDVSGGTGVTKVPDIVASIRRTWWNRWHIKSALVLRQIRAHPEGDPSADESDNGWGVSFSGRVRTPLLGDDDNILFQLNYGDGIGRYINDLESAGGQDGAFDPVTGELKALTAFGGYMSYQHWWNERMRSTFVVGFTEVDNLDFQLDDAYHQTKRVTANFLYSPIPDVDIGAELLWGERKNKDGNSGDALQLQLAAKYLF